jgi:hypothetical protein
MTCNPHDTFWGGVEEDHVPVHKHIVKQTYRVLEALHLVCVPLFKSRREDSPPMAFVRLERRLPPGLGIATRILLPIKCLSSPP